MRKNDREREFREPYLSRAVATRNFSLSKRNSIYAIERADPKQRSREYALRAAEGETVYNCAQRASEREQTSAALKRERYVLDSISRHTIVIVSPFLTRPASGNDTRLAFPPRQLELNEPEAFP